MTTNRRLPSKLRGPKQVSKQTTNAAQPKTPSTKDTKPNKTRTKTRTKTKSTKGQPSPGGFALPPIRPVVHNMLVHSFGTRKNDGFVWTKPPGAPDFVFEKGQIYANRTVGLLDSFSSFSFVRYTVSTNPYVPGGQPESETKEEISPDQQLQDCLKTTTKFLAVSEPKPPANLARWNEQQERIRKMAEAAEVKVPESVEEQYDLLQKLTADRLAKEADDLVKETMETYHNVPPNQTTGAITLTGKNTAGSGSSLTNVGVSTSGKITTSGQMSSTGAAVLIGATSAISPLVDHNPEQTCWTQEVYNLKTRTVETIALNYHRWIGIMGGDTTWYRSQDDSTFDLKNPLQVTKPVYDYENDPHRTVSTYANQTYTTQTYTTQTVASTSPSPTKGLRYTVSSKP